MKSNAVQHTVRGIPIEVDQKLREKAERENISINQVIVDTLSEAFIGRPVRADFSRFVGAWKEDKKFDEVLEDQRKIDEDDWK